MRMLRGEPVERSVELLSTAQRAALQKVVDDNSTESARLREVRDVLKGHVRDALAAGVPARVIATELNISRGRVYQMKDEIEG